MSHYIVKGISIKGDKVFIRAASNNVVPKSYRKEVCQSLTDVLQKQGKQACELEILKDYEGGNMQPGTQNKYSLAVHVLRNMPEYAVFDWRNNNAKWGTPEYVAYKEKRKSKEFDELLLKALNTKLSPERYIITKTVYDGQKVFYCRNGRASFCRWYENKEKATPFMFEQDAVWAKKGFTGSENWQIEKL